jgi:arylsulfatase A
VPLLLGTGDGGAKVFFYYDDNVLSAVRKGPWKACIAMRPGYGPDRKNLTRHDPPLLFQVEQDPSERFDVSKDHPAVVADLLAEIERHRAGLKVAPSQLD